MARVKNCSPPINVPSGEQLLSANDPQLVALLATDQILAALANE